MENMSGERGFLAWFTLGLICFSLWIFRDYLHYILVAGVLAMATSHHCCSKSLFRNYPGIEAVS